MCVWKDLILAPGERGGEEGDFILTKYMAGEGGKRSPKEIIDH